MDKKSQQAPNLHVLFENAILVCYNELKVDTFTLY